MERPEHLNNFFSNVTEANDLAKIHLEIAGKKPGRKDKKVQILNKSSIVLLTACWETYVEEVVSAGFEFLIENCEAHSNIPSSVLVKSSKQLKDDKDNSSIWKLAGDGWKDILKEYGNEILGQKIDYFHVPRPDNIDTLYENLLGMKKVTSHWKWKNMNNNAVKTKLNDFIDLRGSIAHKIKTDRNVWKKDVKEYRILLIFISIILHNRVNDFLKLKTGKRPWFPLKYRTIK